MMTKLEQIREGLAKILAEQGGEKWENVLVWSKDCHIKNATEILQYLNRQGIVFVDKDKELPRYYQGGTP